MFAALHRGDAHAVRRVSAGVKITPAHTPRFSLDQYPIVNRLPTCFGCSASSTNATA